MKRSVTKIGFALAYLPILLIGEISSTKEEELNEARDFFQGMDVQPPEEILEWLKSKKILEEKPIEEFGDKELPPIELSLNEAVATTLENQWQIDIAESEVTRRFGEWQSTAGPFDPVLTTSLRGEWLLDPQQIGFKTDDKGTITTLNAVVEKLTRPGTSFSVGTTVQRVHDPSLASVSPGIPRFTQSTLTFQMTQPLLRRFLYNQESVDEIVSSLQYEAAQYLLVQTMAEEVLNTILAYWEMVAAEKVVEINEDAQQILEGLASSTFRLVEAEQLAASELNEQIAELSRNRRDLIASRQDVYETYNTLLFQMGERKCEFSENLPHLIVENFTTPFPHKRAWDIDCLLQQAYLHRGDLIAARIRLQETDVQLRLARNNILPELDMIFGVELLNNTVGSSGQRFFSSYYPNDMEKDLSAEVRLSIPFWNDRARGERTQKYQERMQAFLEENELWSGIYNESAVALREQIELVDEIYYANKAAEWYEIALRDEILRTKAGYGSLFVVIDFENRFRRILIERVNVKKQYAQNIARLLFLTGTLVLIDPVTHEVLVDPLNCEHLVRHDEQN
ncbi:MAG: hypothetical protein K940chlam9_00883 [Chlamydiae bacterium]|nr:hypothetical protein [Chlamydiota bacterium]